MKELLKLLGRQHGSKFFVMDLAVSVSVHLLNHRLDLLIRELLPQVVHDPPQLCRSYDPIVVLVEDFEGHSYFIIIVKIVHLPLHDGQELRDVNGPIVIRINLVDHIPELSFSGILTERLHGNFELLDGNDTVVVFVKQREGLLELSNLILSQLARHLAGTVY